MRYVPRASEAERMSTEALREAFLVGKLFQPGSIQILNTDLDRLAVGGVMPEQEIPLPACGEFGTRYFLERRELGVLNLGPPGTVRVRGESFRLETLDCLYVGMGEPEVTFAREGAEPPCFYFLSCPAHRKYPTAKLPRAGALRASIGEEANASRRCLNKCIYPGGLQSCQLVMGFTELAPGSVWNTMPPHTHSRRSEVYLYFDLGDQVVFHLLGRPQSTRHVVVRDREAVLSPPWSMHAGTGTSSYRFVWGMAGENQNFDDMDGAEFGGLA